MIEDVLIKVLEYGKISNIDSFKAISQALSLEFYYESNPILYTLSSENFVLDISEDLTCTLTFVNDELNLKFDYIQKYLTFYLTNKKYFYFLLKFLVHCSSNQLNDEDTLESADYEKDMDNSKISVHRFFCDCIMSSKYCCKVTLNNIRIPDFNIFTHQTYEKEYIPQIKDDAGLEYVNMLLPFVFKPYKIENLAWFFIPDGFKVNHMNNNSNSIYLFENLKIVGKSIYINDERSQIASFGFNHGLTLKESIDLLKIFN